MIFASPRFIQTLKYIFIFCLLDCPFGLAKSIQNPKPNFEDRTSTPEKLDSSDGELRLSAGEWQKYLKQLKDKVNPKGQNTDWWDSDSLLSRGPGTSGGGNSYESEFIYLASQLLKDISKIEISTSLKNAIMNSFHRLKSEDALVFSKKKLYLNNKEKIAINDYAVFILLVNERLWDSSTFFQKRHIIIHELLGLAKSVSAWIDDSDYSLSNQIIEKIQRVDKKNFLLNSDYPKAFKQPEIKTLRLFGSDISYEFAANKGTCLKSSSKINVDMISTKTAKGDQLQIMFEIDCLMENGRRYAHIEGRETGNFLDLTSGNILELHVDYGNFVVGWVSEHDMLIRTPFQLLKIQKNSDEIYNLKIEIYNPKDPSKTEIFEVPLIEVNRK